MAFNFGSGAAGGLGGAGTGAAIGSSFLPGIGTALGAGAGGLIGFLSGGFGGGKEGKFKQRPLSDQAQQIIQYLQSSGLQNLQNPYEGFQPIEDYATHKYNTEIIPGLAERFTAMEGQRSGAFRAALGNAGPEFVRNLAMLKSQYGMQNQQNALQRLQLGLGQEREGQYFQDPERGLGANIFSGFMDQLPEILQYLQERQQGQPQQQQKLNQNTQLLSPATSQQGIPGLNNPAVGFSQPQLSQNYFQSLLQPHAPTQAFTNMRKSQQSKLQPQQQQPRF